MKNFIPNKSISKTD